MTDIEVLRENVINAARAWRDNGDIINADELVDAVDALDAALAPNPWALLAEYIGDTDGADGQTWDDFCKSWEPRVKAALAWREANP